MWPSCALPCRCTTPPLRDTSKVCSRSTTAMSWIDPEKRVRPVDVLRLAAMFSCVRRASSRLTRAMSSRTKMGFVR